MQKSTKVQKEMSKYRKQDSNLKRKFVAKLLEISRTQRSVINNCDKTIILVQAEREQASENRIEAENALQEIK